jgi:pimeloyl-ACP methyl ester carboxylesterase
LQKLIQSGRASLAVEVVGDGDPIVFLHAAVADKRMWRAQIESVGVNNKAIAYDRRGFGETLYGEEEFSSVTDLLAVIEALAGDKHPILVGCSQGGRIALDAALLHPSKIRGLVLIAPNIAGAPEEPNSFEIRRLLEQQKEVIEAGNVDDVNFIKARLWLDGPLAPEGRVGGEARQLLFDMNAIVLQSPPTGTDVDITSVSPAFHQLKEISMPSLIIWGDLDFPHIQDRCRLAASNMANGSSHELVGTGHLPSLDRPEEISRLIEDFSTRC